MLFSRIFSQRVSALSLFKDVASVDKDVIQSDIELYTFLYFIYFIYFLQI